jgi:hypothetical protein
MIATGGCFDQVAAPQRELAHHERRDEWIARHGQVAVVGASYESALARGIEPPCDRSVGDDWLRWAAVARVLRTWTTAPATTSTSPTVVGESSVSLSMMLLLSATTALIVHLP